MKHKKCTYFLLTFVLLLSFGIIQKKEGLKAEESGVSSGHIYKVSPTGYVCGTTPPSANILEAQFVPDDVNHNIEVRVRKCAGGNLISDGNAYVRVDNFKDYTYEVSTTDYVCGTTPPTQGIVALRLTPDDTNHDLYVRVRKCDSGDFSKDGKVYITVDGQQKWGPYDYNAGDSSIRFDINPVGHSEGIVGKHTYQAEVYPTGQAEPILSGEIDAWETYASYTWGPFFRNAGISEFTFDIDPVDDKSIVGTHTYQVHWYPNGQDNPIRTGNITAWDEAAPSAVDLRPTNESIETLSPFFAGSSIGVQANIENTGSENATASHIGYWVANASNGNPININYKHNTPMQNISAGSQSAAMYEDVNIPVGITAGTYYLVFEADTEGAVAESNEDNNRDSLSFTISPCDTSNMYCDVASDRTFREEIEALRDKISNGCRSATNDNTYGSAVFCPDAYVGRDAMAVFMVRRKLRTYNPTLGTYQGYFVDVSEETTQFALWIEKAYELGIVEGCEGTTPGVDLKYCPNYDTSGWAGIVTRGQVAIFLARTEGWDLNNSTTGVFDDVTGDNEWERAVEYMWWQGYIHGVPPEIGCQNSSPTGDLIYCGSDYVNRGTAAGFMSRVFGYVTTQPRCNVLTVSTNPSDAGSVSKNPVPDCPIDSSKYKFDTSITLTANPNTGYTFNSWSGYASGSDNPVTIVLDRQDRAVTANFQEGSLVVNLLPSNESVQTTEPFFAGSSIGVQSSVKNAGGASAAASKIGYWVSGSSNGVPSNDIYTHTNPVPSLSAGSTSDLLYEDVGIPVGLAPGDYYVVFDADTEEAVAESNESDNKASVPFTISPCDTSNMYCDVASDRTFREEIEALRDKISNGCRSATNDNIYGSAVFCPDAYVGRDAMAVFMVRRKLGTYNPTLGSYQGYFVDVSEETTPFALWIEKAYELGIVEGCEEGEPYKDLKYCPNYDMSGWAGIVTRAQVAIFLARTEGWDLSDPTTGVFDDVTGDSEWERAVEYMWWQGYTNGVPVSIGCQNSSPSGDHIYCPGDYVNRGVAAAFMSRAFGYVTTIRGYVRDSNNNGIDGVTINFSGGYGSVETSHGGFYHHTGFPDGTYTLTPSKSGYSFTPSSATVSATGGNVTQDFVVTDAASPALIRSRLYVDERNYLALEFCGTNIHQDIYIGSKRDGRDFGIHTMRVDFGETEECATDDNLADGVVLLGTTYHSGVALTQNNVYNICGSDQGLCDSITTPTPSTGFRLPFPGGTSRICTQYPHSGNRPIVDWSYGDGIVVAAQDGIVDYVKDNSDVWGCDEKFGPYGNYITIRHPDGNKSIYLHLKKDSALVTTCAVDATKCHVKSGQPIAELGYSGYMCGSKDPRHLHYYVKDAVSGSYITPSFLDISTNNGVPQFGKTYISANNWPDGLSINSLPPTDEYNYSPIGDVSFELIGQNSIYNIGLTAYDYESDFLQMRISATESGLQSASWQPFTSEMQWVDARVWVQYKDEADSLSPVYSDTLQSSAYQAVQADFSVKPTLCTHSAISITNLTSLSCPQCGWLWNMDNGITSTLDIPLSPYVGYPDITYEEPGVYTITLTASSTVNTDSISKSITVFQSPSASFSSTRSGNTVFVQANSENAINWEWNFGDGVTETGQTATHTYADSTDTYFVHLKVTGSNGCIDFAYEIIRQVNRVYIPLVIRDQ